MDLEPVESGSLAELIPARRRSARVAGAIAALVAVTAVSVTLGGGSEAPLKTATAPEQGSPAPTHTDVAGSTDTTAEAAGAEEDATTTSSSAASPSSTAPASTTTTRRTIATPTSPRPTTTGPRPTTTVTSGPARGVVLAVDEPGVWVADLETGTVRRIADPGPFDLTGDSVLTTKGRQIFATPLAGGATVVRYEAPSQGDPARESVVWIDAGIDGSAVVGIFASIYGGSSGNYLLLDPSGRRAGTEYVSSEFAWSADGTKLAATSFASRPAPTLGTPPTGPSPPPRRTLVVLDAAGKVLHGPTDADEVQGLHGLRWAGDGRSVVAQGANGGAVYRWHPADGRFSILPTKSESIDIGVDGRILATRSIPENDMAVDFLDPVTGALKPFVARGDRPSWSPDGRSVLVAAIPPPHYGNTPYPLAVYSDAGVARFSITIPDRLAFGQGSAAYRALYPQGPQWSVSSRYVAFAVYPR